MSIGPARAVDEVGVDSFAALAAEVGLSARFGLVALAELAGRVREGVADLLAAEWSESEMAARVGASIQSRLALLVSG